MVLSFGGGGSSKPEDVNTLLAKKNYAKAVELLKQQLRKNARDPRLRLQLGDALAMAGKNKEAVEILLPLADEFANDGFSAKAISVLKKIQKLDPSRRDISTRLANVIQEKQKVAAASLPVTPSPSSGGFELGMEEIGIDIGAGPIAVSAPSRPAPEPQVVKPAAPPQPAPAPKPAPAPQPAAAPPPAPKPAAPAPAPKPAAPPPQAAPPPRPAAPPPAPEPAFGGADDIKLDLGADAVDEFSLTEVEAEPVSAPVDPPPVEDMDLWTEEEEGIDGEELVLEAEPMAAEPEPDASGEEGLGGLFGDELLSLVDEAFANLPTGEDGTPQFAPEDQGGGNQIVVSPLFKDLAVDELVAVIQGLNLMMFQPRQVIIREGSTGSSLYMLTAGTVKIFKKNPTTGKQTPVGELAEGAFFGEGSILSGKPRNASVVAQTYCELLELDRPTLDGIVQKYPRVWTILEDFAKERSG